MDVKRLGVNIFFKGKSFLIFRACLMVLIALDSKIYEAYSIFSKKSSAKVKKLLKSLVALKILFISSEEALMLFLTRDSFSISEAV